MKIKLHLKEKDSDDKESPDMFRTENRLNQRNRRTSKSWAIALLGAVAVLALFVMWPAIVTLWASNIKESPDSGATLSQFNLFCQIHSSLGVLFTGLAGVATAATFYLQYMSMEVQKEKLKNERLAREEQMRGEIQKRKEREHAAHEEKIKLAQNALFNIFMDGKNTLSNIKGQLFFASRTIDDIDGERVQLNGSALLVEAGCKIEQWIHNIQVAEEKGMGETFGNVQTFLKPFMDSVELSFQLLGACEPWMQAFCMVSEELEEHGELAGLQLQRYKKYLANTLNRYEKILLMGYCMAIGLENPILNASEGDLFENTSDNVKSIAIRLLRTFEMKGKGLHARMKIIEEVSGVKIIERDVFISQKLLPILQYAAEKSGIRIENAVELVGDKDMAEKLLKFAKYNGWLLAAPMIFFGRDSKVPFHYLITSEGRDFVASFKG